MDSIQQDSILYITAALCTFLAILVSYRWLVRQSAVKAKDDGHKKDAVAKETEETKDEEEIKTPLSCPFGFVSEPRPPKDEKEEVEDEDDDIDDNIDNINDLLINSSDIQPLDEDEKKRLEEIAAMENQEKLDRRKIKELEEEVQKSMSEQQLDDERKTRQAQLEAIFSLMQENNDRFGIESVDDVQKQYKLYV
ncbi:matrix-remodeling-associated protein 7-like [Asterias rubens]|uniref:matrix-remodeling-associated protein 7-like n=1 Tax=Asterias rubens TaxID=7604 RepID=UPI0014556DB1|nr:matrix-remodeling-associated protein 7-like [Asterias rubens]